MRRGMGYLAAAQLCYGCFFPSMLFLATQREVARAFCIRPHTGGAGTTQRLHTSYQMSSQPEVQAAPVTRKTVFQDISTLAGVIAASGAVLLGDTAAGGADGLPIPSTSTGVVTEEDRQGVEETTIRWKDTVTLNTPDAPKRTAGLYALDGVLWGTVSEEVRDTPEEIYDYFDYFARLPKLRVSQYDPVSVRVYGDFATQAGTYTFAWQGADGATMEKKARFSFTFRRDAESPTGWTIVEHHSSAMPTAPSQLKRARNDAV